MMNVLASIRQHIILNLKLYAIIAVAFLAGVLIAVFSVVNISDTENKELLLYMNDFFENITMTGLDGLSILKLSVCDNIKGILILTMFSFMIIGAPFVGVMCAVYGYMSAFTLFFLIKSYGISAILFFVAGLLPHWLILFPAYSFFMMSCLKFSTKALGYNNLKKQRSGILEFMILALVVFIITVCASLIQAYVEPWFISLVSKYYI